MFCYREIHLIVSRLEFSLLVRVDVAFRLSKKCGAGIVKTPTLFNQHVINIHQNDFENEHVFAVLKVFPDDHYTWHTHTHTHESKLAMQQYTSEIGRASCSERVSI